MRLFSSKKICLGIAAAAVLFAAALVGVSAYRSVAARHTFAEDGYILTIEEDEEQIVVNRQNSFTAGSRYASAGVSSVSYQSADGGSVQVDSDSFIHYESSSLASVADGTIADLDDYLDGVIGCYSLAAGNTLSWTGSVFTIASGDGEKQFENFVWKSSSVRCLMGSPQLTISFSGGQEEIVTSGFLELSYMDEESSVVQLTDGESAWQVVAEGCSITFANGVVLDAASGNILTPEEAEVYAAGETVSVRLSLGTIEIDASAYTSLGTSYASTQSSPPSFLFTIVNGADGEDGSDGADGETGADGVEGETGAQGADGADGEDGSAGSGGVGGYTDTSVRNGTVTIGDNVYTGQPEVIVCENTWNIMSDGTFSLAYDEDSYDAIDVATNSAHVYLYNVETGEIIQEWGQDDDLTLTDQATAFSIYDTDAKYTDVVLETGTTYAIIVTDTYMLGGTTYTAKVMERMFTTDDTSLSVSLTARTTGSFGVSLGSYTSVSSVTLTVKDANGNAVYDNYELTGITDFSSFEIEGLSPDTWYSVELEVTAVPEGSTVAVSSTFSFEWTTLKEAPTVGGVSLTASSGYLTAEILGAYNNETSVYGEIVDDYETIESVTYYLYTVDTTDTTVLALSDTQTSTAGGSWPAYFENVANNTTYYVIAEYSWTDGTSSYTTTVMESDSTKSASGYSAISTPSGRTWASAKAQSGSGIILSFSGSSEIWNSSTDTSLGTTYESIKGSVNVNLNGTRIRVDSVRTLSLTVTDNLIYEKTWTFDNAGGVEGDVEGIFALPVDLDGLLIGTTYSMTLSGYVYSQNSDTPTLQTLGTLTVRTDDDAEIEFGMQLVDTGGIGVEFALGDTTYATAITKDALYDLSSGTYDDSYYEETSAAYRNLSSIVFELYGLSNVSKDTGGTVNYDNATETLIGTCEVVVLDENTGEKATVTPGYSLLYQNYYGKNAASSGTNTVGVGEEFNYRFEYASSTNRSGEVSTEYIEQVSDYYRIRVTLCYDYTYDRYTYEASDGEDTPYDYILYTKGLDLDDYVNEPTINTEESYVNIPWQDRPISPTSSYVLDSSGSAITAEPLANGEVNDFAWSSNASGTDLYDAALEETTGVGMSLETTFTDSSARTRRVSFYGMNYALDTVWETTYGSVSLSDVADATYTTDEGDTAYVLPFKFTLWMTQDGEAPDSPDYDDLDDQVADADETATWRTTIPTIYLLIGEKGMSQPTYGGLDWESVSEYSASKDRGYY